MKKSAFVNLIIGTVGGLLFALGMCMIMVWNLMLPGILVGLLGLIMVALAYPL